MLGDSKFKFSETTQVQQNWLDFCWLCNDCHFFYGSRMVPYQHVDNGVAESSLLPDIIIDRHCVITKQQGRRNMALSHWTVTRPSWSRPVYWERLNMSLFDVTEVLFHHTLRWSRPVYVHVLTWCHLPRILHSSVYQMVKNKKMFRKWRFILVKNNPPTCLYNMSCT